MKVFQIVCASEVTAFGIPGMMTSVALPQPSVVPIVSGVQFTFSDPQGMIIATPNDYQVTVPLTGSTTFNIQVNAVGPSSIIQRSCQISVIVTGNLSTAKYC